jgi:hypothetical protein
MTLINGSIPNLINGISQQPPSVRLPSQAELQENAYSSVSDGVGKRAPTQHIAHLLTNADATDFPLVHFVNRDESERYVQIFQNGRVKVFDLEGTEYPVRSTLFELEYLNCDTPSTDLSAITLADTTFVLNRQRETAMLDTATPDAGFQALLWFRQGNYAITYTVTIDGKTFTYTTPPDEPGEIETWAIAKILFHQLRADLSSRDWSVRWRQGDNVIWITRHDREPFSIDVKDGNANNNLKLVTDQVQKFSDLPSLAPNGFTAKILGDFSSNADDYYVNFVTNDDAEFGSGLWEECAAPNIPYQFDERTLPHILVRLQDTDGSITGIPGAIYFQFKKNPHDYRTVGDDLTNPIPSFIGQTINHVFFHRNRLGYLSGTNCILSRSGRFSAFWRQTALEILDSDVIDVSAATPRVVALRHAVPFNEELILFGEQTQLVLSGGDLLTPKTVSIKPATEYANDLTCSPIAAENLIYFPFDNGTFAGLREFFVSNANTGEKDSNLLTAHVQRYIPAPITKLTASTTEDALVALTASERISAYLYQWRWNGQDKIQSAWSKWTFGDNCIIQGAEFIGPTLWIVTKRSCGQYLEKMELTLRSDPNCNYVTHLDRRITDEQTTVVFNAFKNETTFELPYKPDVLPLVFTRAIDDEEWKPAIPVKVTALKDCDPPPPPPPVDTRPIVTVFAADPTANEADPTETGTFTFSRTGDVSAALTITVTYTGSATIYQDYNLTPDGTSVVFPAGEASVSVVVTALPDNIDETDETVIVTIQPDLIGATYRVGRPDSAEVVIVNHNVTDPGPPPPGGCTCDPLAPFVVGTTTAEFTYNYSIDQFQSGNPPQSGSGTVSLPCTIVFGGGDSADFHAPGFDANYTPGSGWTFSVSGTLTNLSGNPEDWNWGARSDLSDPKCSGSGEAYTGGDEQGGAIVSGGFSVVVCDSGAGSLPAIPTDPSGLTVVTPTETSLTVSWTDNSSNETGFKVERSADGLTGWTVVNTTAANATSFVDSNLAPGTTYYYRVRAFNAGGNSGYTSVVSNMTTTPLLIAPAGPSVLTAATVSSSKIHLAWTDNSVRESGFKIEHSLDNVTFTQIAAVGVNVVTYDATGLSGGVIHYFRVRAYNQYGNSAYSNTANATTTVSSPPAPPNTLTATAISSSRIDLTWVDGSVREDGYRVQRATNSAGPWTTIFNTAANVVAYSDLGLSSGVQYYYRVCAFNGYGNSSFSNTANATTPAASVPPGTPTGLSAKAVSTSQITLTWADNSNNETGYEVERSLDGVTFAKIVSLPANSITYNNTGLNSGVKYYYQVRTTNAAGNSAYSNIANATTQGTPGPEQTGLTMFNTGESRTVSTCGMIDNKWTADGRSAWSHLRIDNPSWAIPTNTAANWISYAEDTDQIREVGTSASPLIWAVHFFEDVDIATAGPLLTTAGVDGVRIPMWKWGANWNVLPTHNDFNVYRNWIAAGFKTICCLTPSKPPPSDAIATAWFNALASATSDLKWSNGVNHRFEIGNEPNLSAFWQGGDVQLAVTALLKPAFQILDPAGFRVVGFALSAAGGGTFADDAANDKGKIADLQSYGYFNYCHEGAWHQYGGTPAESANGLAAVRSVWPVGTPLLITEYGLHVGSIDGPTLAAVVANVRNYGDGGAVYRLFPNATAGGRIGLLTAVDNLTPFEPLYTAFKDATTLANSSPPEAVVRNFSTTIYVGGDIDLSTLSITGSLSVDDTIEDIVVNGQSTHLTFTAAQEWTDLHAFTIPATYFVHGPNTVKFKVKNVGVSGLNNPTGLLVIWDKPNTVTPNVVTVEMAGTEFIPVTASLQSFEGAQIDDPVTATEQDPCTCRHRLIVSGDWRDKAVWIGQPYTMLYRFSPIFLRSPNQGGGVASVNSGRLQLRNMTVGFNNTGYFRAEVTPAYRETSPHVYAARRVGTPTTRIGDVPEGTDSLRFMVNSKNDQVTIDLVNDSILPSHFQNAEWEGEFYSRARRV